MALVAPSPETAVALPFTEALSSLALASCGCLASAGYPRGSDVHEIAQHAASITLRVILIVISANLQILKMQYKTET
jgi:hypothetical protein